MKLEVAGFIRGVDPIQNKQVGMYVQIDCTAEATLTVTMDKLDSLATWHKHKALVLVLRSSGSIHRFTGFCRATTSRIGDFLLSRLAKFVFWPGHRKNNRPKPGDLFAHQSQSPMISGATLHQSRNIRVLL